MGDWSMGRELLVCTWCKSGIFVDSIANTAPRWTGRVGDPLETRIAIEGQDDLCVFKRKHLRHEMIEVELNQE